ncbi:flagellar motor protein MotB [Thiomicrorhabdus indica]|uniref:OmpA/MotB family protein n=1 Tax=Thiomicrorhabdus indica TaxID=2267253 RepID=UPI002AA79C05|nr:flagellar motor protein MotB [Thiomicrorhabdus indica]
MGRRYHEHDEGGAHGGSWKIALADLMTVLMVFFLVMWLIAIVEPEQRKAFVDNVLGQGDSVMINEAENQGETQGTDIINPIDLKPPVTLDEIQESLKELNPKDIDIQETDEKIIITLKSDSFFESGRASINDAVREELEKLAMTLVGRGQLMTITGYTDNVPINNFQFPSNWELSAARAGTVARTFIYMDVDKSLISIIGKADNEAVAPNDTPYGRSLNRRVIIEVDKSQQGVSEPLTTSNQTLIPRQQPGQ